MKRLKFASIVAISTALYFSCDLEVPESVTVKSDGAEFNVPFGSSSFLIRDKLSAAKLQETLSENKSEEENKKNITVYEFNPTNEDDALLEFIMDYPVENTKLKTNDESGKSITISEEFENLIKEQAQDMVTYPKTILLNPVEGKVETGMNFADILSSFGSDDEDSEKTDYSYIFNNIRFSGIEAYAYLSSSVLSSENTTLTGSIYATTNPDVSKDEYSVADDSQKQSIATGVFPLKESPLLEKFADENLVITNSEFIAEDKYSAKLDGNVITEMLNGNHESFSLVYKITPTITVQNAEELKALKEKIENASFSVNLVVRFPLKLEVTDDITIEDVLDIAGNALDEDLFDRDGADDDKLSKFDDLFQDGGMSIKYLIADTTGLGFSTKISAVDENGSTILDKEIEFQTGKSILNENGDVDLTNTKSIDLSATEVRNILNMYPFCPKIGISISKTETPIEIKRNAEFGTWAAFKLKTGGQYTVWEK